MNILLVSSDNNKTSGAFLCLVDLATYLKNIGINVIVVIPKKGDGTELLEKNKLRYKLIPSFSWVTYNGYSPKAIAKYVFKKIAIIYNKKAIREIKKLIINEKIDIVHINTIFSYVGALAAKETNTSFIWHIRESLEKGFSSHIIWGKRGYDLINCADHIITVSDMLANEYSRLLAQSNQSTIYDGIDETCFYKMRDILNKTTITIACIGSLIKDKNQSELISAAKRLYSNGFSNFKILLIGKGEEENRLKSIVREEGLTDYISFLGQCSNVEEILQEVDIVCSVSRSEAFGRTLVEGMLSGCLVIAAESLSSAANEIIENKETGLLYKLHDISGLTSLIEGILSRDKDNFYRKIALAGQRKCMDKFTARRNAEKIVYIYKKIIKGNSKMKLNT